MFCFSFSFFFVVLFFLGWFPATVAPHATLSTAYQSRTAFFCQATSVPFPPSSGPDAKQIQKQLDCFSLSGPGQLIFQPPSSVLIPHLQNRIKSFCHKPRETSVFLCRFWEKSAGFHIPPAILCFDICFRFFGEMLTSEGAESERPNSLFQKNRKPPVPMCR